jgi:hypothetical protein
VPCNGVKKNYDDPVAYWLDVTISDALCSNANAWNADHDVSKSVASCSMQLAYRLQSRRRYRR